WRPALSRPGRTAAMVRPAMKALPMPIRPSRPRKSSVGYTASNMPQVVVECKGYTHRRKEPEKSNEISSRTNQCSGARRGSWPRLGPGCPQEEGARQPARGDVRYYRRHEDYHSVLRPIREG